MDDSGGGGRSGGNGGGIGNDGNGRDDDGNGRRNNDNNNNDGSRNRNLNNNNNNNNNNNDGSRNRNINTVNDELVITGIGQSSIPLNEVRLFTSSRQLQSFGSNSESRANQANKNAPITVLRQGSRHPLSGGNNNNNKNNNNDGNSNFNSGQNDAASFWGKGGPDVYPFNFTLKLYQHSSSQPHFVGSEHHRWYNKRSQKYAIYNPFWPCPGPDEYVSRTKLLYGTNATGATWLNEAGMRYRRECFLTINKQGRKIWDINLPPG